MYSLQRFMSILFCYFAEYYYSLRRSRRLDLWTNLACFDRFDYPFVLVLAPYLGWRYAVTMRPYALARQQTGSLETYSS
jgi:hypothetical protein